MQVIRIAASHFNAKKDEFFKVLDLESGDTRLQWIFSSFEHNCLNGHIPRGRKVDIRSQGILPHIHDWY